MNLKAEAKNIRQMFNKTKQQGKRNISGILFLIYT